MEFCLLEILGDRESEDFADYCFVDEAPDLDGAHWTRLRLGRSLEADYPTDPARATLPISGDRPGIKLTSFIANTSRILIVHQSVAAVIQEHEVGPLEVFPFTLLNAKGRTHSSEHVFLNPLDLRDCLHDGESEILFHPNGRLWKAKRVVLDGAKLESAPDLFRIREVPYYYVFSKRLADVLRAPPFTNFAFTVLEISP